MDQIKSLPTQDIPGVILPTWQLYAPLLNANAEAITSTPAQTYSYGSHERQKLDLYTSPSSNHRGRTGSTHKVLVFVYGGGFAQGDRTLPFPALNKLAYANVGSFFATNYGFSVIVPDYRRIHDAGEPKFPSGGEDLEKTLDWIAENQDKLGAPVGSKVEIYVLGNSAGGAHTATLLLHPAFKATRQKFTGAGGGGGANLPKFRGSILLSTPFAFPPAMAGVLGPYFGNEPDALAKKSPLGLLRSLDVSNETPKFIEAGVRTLALTTELDPQGFHLSRDNFVKEWTEKFGGKVRLDVATVEGHNHISPPLALATGVSREEEWGRKVAEWILEN